MRTLYLIGAALSFALAVAGVALPILPSTPFLLVTSFCLVRSSPRLDARLRRSPLFGRLIDDFEKHRGVRLPVKITALTTLTLAVFSSLWLADLGTWPRALLIALALTGAIVILRLKTVRDEA